MAMGPDEMDDLEFGEARPNERTAPRAGGINFVERSKSAQQKLTRGLRQVRPWAKADVVLGRPTVKVGSKKYKTPPKSFGWPSD